MRDGSKKTDREKSDFLMADGAGFPAGAHWRFEVLAEARPLFHHTVNSLNSAALVKGS
jgi:hypothetical protein